jgi:hypothetical protein
VVRGAFVCVPIRAIAGDEFGDRQFPERMDLGSREGKGHHLSELMGARLL